MKENMDVNITKMLNHLQRISKPINNGSLRCYDKIEEFHDKRERAWFWLEGVLLFVVGILGLLGNILAIFILSRCPTNTEFDVLLI